MLQGQQCQQQQQQQQQQQLCWHVAVPHLGLKWLVTHFSLGIWLSRHEAYESPQKFRAPQVFCQTQAGCSTRSNKIADMTLPWASLANFFASRQLVCTSPGGRSWLSYCCTWPLELYEAWDDSLEWNQWFVNTICSNIVGQLTMFHFWRVWNIVCMGIVSYT